MMVNNYKALEARVMRFAQYYKFEYKTTPRKIEVANKAITEYTQEYTFTDKLGEVFHYSTRVTKPEHPNMMKVLNCIIGKTACVTDNFFDFDAYSEKDTEWPDEEERKEQWDKSVGLYEELEEFMGEDWLCDFICYFKIKSMKEGE